MKQIIGGKKYDTSTAEEIASRWNGLSVTDFCRVKEWLYRKKTGEYFLHGTGGAASIYAESCGNTRCGGEKIIPLTIDEAKEWMERYDNEHYEDVFGEVVE